MIRKVPINEKDNVAKVLRRLGLRLQELWWKNWIYTIIFLSGFLSLTLVWENNNGIITFQVYFVHIHSVDSDMHRQEW